MAQSSHYRCHPERSEGSFLNSRNNLKEGVAWENRFL